MFDQQVALSRHRLSDYRAAMHATIYKIVAEAAWREAEETGFFKGAAIDLSDGYIHFSTVDQVRETAARHFAGQADLVLVAVEAKKLGDKLKYEPSRGGALFPHLYAPLDRAAVRWVRQLPLGSSNEHLFPELEP
jgi:uncharacterized protein (DUF952 family)